MTQANAQPAARTPGSMPPPPGGTTQSANIPLILIAVGLGLVTVIATNWYIHKIKTQVASDMIVIYKLNRSVEPGDKLRDRDITPQKVPRSLQDSYVEGLGCITASDKANQIGQTFKRYAKASSFLTYELFTATGGAGGRNLQPREGKRSLTVPVDGDWTPRTLDPNDIVDISAVLNIPGRRTQDVLIMERVRVLGVGDRMLGSQGTGRSRSISTVTIEVTPEEKSALVTIGRYAVDEEFILAERNQTDTDIKIDSGSINPDVLKMLGIKMDSN
jgi:Flp pilus assembly protein CpaB